MATTRYAKIRRELRDGDLLLFRNGGLIPWASEGPYSHAAIVVKRNHVVAIAESREFKGARVVTLSSQVRKYPGKIDVYRPRVNHCVREVAADIAFRHAGHAYNYRGVLVASLLRMLAVRAVLQLCGVTLDPTHATDSPWAAPKFCSQLAIWCYRRASDRSFDPCPFLSDEFVTPNHLGHSNAFVKIFEGLV